MSRNLGTAVWKTTKNEIKMAGLRADTRWFKYDRDKLWLVYTQIVPVIFKPPCILTLWHSTATLVWRSGRGVFQRNVSVFAYYKGVSPTNDQRLCNVSLVAGTHDWYTVDRLYVIWHWSNLRRKTALPYINNSVCEWSLPVSLVDGINAGLWVKPELCKGCRSGYNNITIDIQSGGNSHF
jgi:hypothetical protein